MRGYSKYFCAASCLVAALALPGAVGAYESSTRSTHEVQRHEEPDTRSREPDRRFGPDPRWPPGPAYRGHEQAREAVRRGEALPLRLVLQRIRPQYAGRVLRVQFFYDPHFEVWVYDIRMILEGRVLMRLRVDALSAEVLMARGPSRDDREH